MSNGVNKDLLIAVMGNRQQQLEKMVKLQMEQLNAYKEHVDIFKALIAKHEQEAAATLERVSQFLKRLDAQEDENDRLKSELEELKQHLQNSGHNSHAS